MKKNIIAYLLAVLSVVCIPFVLSGCGNAPIEGDETQETAEGYSDESAGNMNCVIICSNHANAEISFGGIGKYVRGAKEAEGYLATVRLDGEPECVSEYDTEKQHNNSKRIKKENDEFVSTTMDEIENVNAESKEIDIVAAVKEANKCLDGANNSELENVVVIIGNGLSTKGVIDLSENDLASTDLSDYASWINKSGQISEFDNIDKIVWCGFEETASPQKEFTTDALVEKLKNFYKKVFGTAGIGEIEFDDSIGGANEPSENLPSVSVVKMPPKPKYQAGDTVSLSGKDSGIRFRGDSAVISKGNKKIKDIASSIKNGDNPKVTIIGYTANHDTDAYGGNKGLGKARAKAVKKVLVSLGCPAKNISIKYGGKKNSGDDDADRCVEVEFE